MARPAPGPEDRFKRLTLDLPVDVHKRLKIRCAELEVPMVELLRGLISDALKKPGALQKLAEGLQSGSRK